MSAHVPSTEKNGISQRLHIKCQILTSFPAAVPREPITDAEDCADDVKESPSHDDDVVDILKEDHDDGRVSNPFEHRAQLAHNAHTPNSEVLTNRYLQQEERYATRKHGDEVRNQECSYKNILLLMGNPLASSNQPSINFC